MSCWGLPLFPCVAWSRLDATMVVPGWTRGALVVPSSKVLGYAPALKHAGQGRFRPPLWPHSVSVGSDFFNDLRSPSLIRRGRLEHPDGAREEDLCCGPLVRGICGLWRSKRHSRATFGTWRRSDAGGQGAERASGDAPSEGAGRLHPKSPLLIATGRWQAISLCKLELFAVSLVHVERNCKFRCRSRENPARATQTATADTFEPEYFSSI